MLATESHHVFSRRCCEALMIVEWDTPTYRSPPSESRSL